MFANVNGTKIAYTDEGKGLPLLFIHGFPLSRGVWDIQVEAFKSRHRVIAPDLRGFGRSRASSGLLTMSQYAEDIWCLIEQLGVGPVILAGHSMGGYIALAFAKSHPKWLRGLILAGTKAGGDAAEIADSRRATAKKVREEGPSVVVDAMAPKMLSAANSNQLLAASVKAFMASATTDGIVSALLGMAVRPDAGAWLGKIRAPTLVVAGADDSVIPPSESLALAEAIPDAQVTVIPNAGHLVALEQGESFNEAIRTWLAWGSEGLKRQGQALCLPGEAARTRSPAQHLPL